MPRGGASEAVSSKRGLLIGCGAIGGFIAHELIRSGITALCLIDNQKLRPENSYRHVSGYVSSDKVSKVDALKESLELYYPYCNISAHAASFEAVIGRGKVKMNDFDFVVVATGNPSTNFYIDTYYRNAKPGTPVIYTWLDPFGIGGHVLITNITSKGCYHCLYDNDDLHNRASWAAPLKDQPRPFLRSISGCGTRYTPYSALDASQTAILATRKTMNVLMGNEKENAIYGWRGSTDVFQKEGYKLSKRFTELSDEDLHNTRNGFSSKQCTHCK
jgi:molybdopterin/thiamine biosynthesis adenylyltransferase